MDNWTKCYEDGWKDHIVPEAFSHPAKMSYGLLKRILSHCKDEGWGGVIVDPFGGIGSMGILGAYENYKVISVELEPRFCIMAAKNYLLHCKKGWCTCGNDGESYLQSLQETISKKIEGSQREQKSGDEECVLFNALPGEMGQRQEIKPTTQEKADGESTLEQREIVDAGNENKTVQVSKQRQSGKREERALEGGKVCLRENGLCDDKGKRQIQSGTRSCHGEENQKKDEKRGDSTSHKRNFTGQSNRKSQTDDNRTTFKLSQHGRQKSQTQGETCKTCGKFIVQFPIHLQGDSRKLCELVESADIIVSSPPFNTITSDKPSKSIVNGGLKMGQSSMGDGYGQTPGQLGSMKAGKVDMILGSPPYAESLKGDGTQKETYEDTRKMRRTDGGIMGLGQSERTKGYGGKGNLGNLKAGDVDVILSSPPYEEGIGHGGNPTSTDKEKALHIANSKRYSETNENLGNQRGDTFWQAAKEIVQQCYQILKPGGHAIWVCKDFVRKGHRVPFSDDWQRLCESAGFKTIHRHRAMLVKEESHKSLFGHDIVKKTERKSFFRRLAEAKGSPKIDWEDVICMVKETK